MAKHPQHAPGRKTPKMPGSGGSLGGNKTPLNIPKEVIENLKKQALTKKEREIQVTQESATKQIFSTMKSRRVVLSPAGERIYEEAGEILNSQAEMSPGQIRALVAPLENLKKILPKAVSKPEARVLTLYLDQLLKHTRKSGSLTKSARETVA